MPMPTDCELLRQYVEKGDEAAFAEVVRRQTNLVYSVALRVSRNSLIAEDVTQGVFMKLAQQARLVCHYDSLAGWLHTAARRRAIDAIRSEERRRNREREAVIMQNDTATPMANWAEIAPLLDEAVERLGERDREAILLRYFNGLSHQEIGGVLHLSENSANKRVERALEKLRGYFARRGVTTTAAALSVVITGHSVHAAPAGLAAKIVPVSLAAAGSTTAGGSLLPALAAHFMSTKLKVLSISAVVLLALTALLTMRAQSAESPDATAGQPVSLPQKPQPATVAASPAALPPAQVAAPVRNVAAQVEAPAAPPIPVVSQPVAATSASAAPADSPARYQIDSAMNDFVNLLQSGDYVQVADTYMQLPPNVSGQQLIDGMSKNPDFPNTIRMLLESTQAAQMSPPVYNDAKDVVTYKLDPPVDGKTVVRWKKINGAWYVDGYE